MLKWKRKLTSPTLLHPVPIFSCALPFSWYLVSKSVAPSSTATLATSARGNANASRSNGRRLHLSNSCCCWSYPHQVSLPTSSVSEEGLSHKIEIFWRLKPRRNKKMKTARRLTRWTWWFDRETWSPDVPPERKDWNILESVLWKSFTQFFAPACTNKIAKGIKNTKKKQQVMHCGWNTFSGH